MSLQNTYGERHNTPCDLERFLKAQFEYHGDAAGMLCPRQNISPDRMFEIVTRKRFRRTKLDAESRADITAKVGAALDRGAPIEFAIPFGAYKHWLLPTYPYPDWAEVFNLKHLIAFAGPIAQSYPPGVVLNYTYTSGVIEKVSNLPTEAQDEYVTALKRLHSYFQHIAPTGLKLRLDPKQARFFRVRSGGVVGLFRAHFSRSGRVAG